LILVVIMDIYYTIEEKYLQAIEEYWYGQSPKSLQLLNEIIAIDPMYAKAYYHLGLIYCYELSDYQAAGYNFKTCNQLDPAFPDVYEHYTHLLAFLDMEKQLQVVKEKALATPGVDFAAIWNILGLHAEKKKDLHQAKTCLDEAFALSTSKIQLESVEENLQRVELKLKRKTAYSYSVI
jgi:tetratricopeptide (TPR) repeat protein